MINYIYFYNIINNFNLTFTGAKAAVQIMDLQHHTIWNLFGVKLRVDLSLLTNFQEVRKISNVDRQINRYLLYVLAKLSSN